MPTLIDDLRERLADEYGTIEPLGSGGYAEVWKCSRTSSGKPVALKCLRPDAQDPDAPRRFSREVRILKSLDHPNIVRVYDARLSESPYYFTMPLYATSLDAEVPDLAGHERRIVPVFERVLDGMEYAHGQGVIHRDLKPGNVLINSDTDVTVSDFGLGRNLHAVTTRQTITGQGLGTIGYLAPEQVDGASEVNARADVYSLGKLLYELLTGDQNPLAPMDFDALPPRFRPIVRKCVKREPDDRYQSVAELKLDWRIATDPDSVRLRRSDIADMIDQASSEVVPADLAPSLAELVENDPDLVREIMMDLPVLVIQTMWETDRDSMRPAVRCFAERVGNGGWGFGYTDKLGNRLDDLFRIVEDDYELSAFIVWSAAALGLGHNRWHVMGLVGKMLRAATDDVHAQQIRMALERIPKHERGQLAPYLGHIPAAFGDLFSDD